MLAQLAAPHMPDGSSMVFVSSIGSYRHGAPLGMYAVTKTALNGLMHALALELGPHIRVNGVAPGTVPTKFAAFISEPGSAARLAIEATTALGRLGTAEEQAAAVAFLASDDASYITGETLCVAGGMQSRL